MKWHQIKGYCGFKKLYADVAQTAQADDIFVEIGNYHGRSLAYLLTLLKGKGAKVYGIDIGIGGPTQWKRGKKRVGVTSHRLVLSLQKCKLLDDVTLIIRDSPKAAHL